MSTPDLEFLKSIDQKISDLIATRLDVLKSDSNNEVGSSNFNLQVQQFINAATTGKLGSIVRPEVIAVLARSIVGASFCRDDRRPTVTYLGPSLSYSYLATVRYFSDHANLIPVSTISAVFEDVLADRTDFGVVPIENSTDGRVIDTLSNFADSPLMITGEVLLPIHHCLLSRSTIQDIQSVHSKPQALSQCRKWLAMHLPHAKLIECSSTSAAAELASSDSSVAAIASYEAGVHFGLNITARNIEDSHNNVTRFAVIGRGTPEPTGNDKTSLMFQIPHRAGALADVMLTFQRYNINLTWIESFPIRGNPNEYLFFVELEGHRSYSSVGTAIKDLSSHTLRLDWLGSYPKASPVS